MVNLMDSAQNTEAPESLIVNVRDHDMPDVPADLGAGSKSSFWKQKDVRIWLYVLGAAILVLVVVFVLLSRQTSLFQGYTRVSVSNDTETMNEGDLEDFNGSAANDNFDGLGETVVGEGDFAATPGEGGSISIDDLLDGVISAGELEANPTDLVSLFDDVDASDDSTVNENTDNFEPIMDDPFAASDYFASAPPVPNTTDIVVNQNNNDFTGMDLNSNTDSGVMESPTMQGDTGPSVILALIPAALYVVSRRKKYEI